MRLSWHVFGQFGSISKEGQNIPLELSMSTHTLCAWNRLIPRLKIEHHKKFHPSRHDPERREQEETTTILKSLREAHERTGAAETDRKSVV